MWAALDCPTSAPVANFGQGPPIVLARLTVTLGPTPVTTGEPYALAVVEELGREGRKRESACVLFDARGSVPARRARCGSSCERSRVPHR